jgi:hypothetical protein
VGWSTNFPAGISTDNDPNSYTETGANLYLIYAPPLYLTNRITTSQYGFSFSYPEYVITGVTVQVISSTNSQLVSHCILTVFNPIRFGNFKILIQSTFLVAQRPIVLERVPDVVFYSYLKGTSSDKGLSDSDSSGYSTNFEGSPKTFTFGGKITGMLSLHLLGSTDLWGTKWNQNYFNTNCFQISYQQERSGLSFDGTSRAYGMLRAFLT